MTLERETTIEQYWPVEDVANRCHVSTDTVKRWLSHGKLRKTKAGGRTLISESHLQLFLKESTEQAAA